jgi:hypothetical protein
VHCFTDSKGNRWEISLTLGSALRVKALGVDFLNPDVKKESDQPMLTRLVTDVELTANVILCLIESQFEKYGMTEQSVKDAFDADTLLAAQTAFFEEVVYFFLKSGRQDQIRIYQKQTSLLRKLIDENERRVGEIDEDEIIRGIPSGNWQG